MEDSKKKVGSELTTKLNHLNQLMFFSCIASIAAATLLVIRFAQTWDFTFKIFVCVIFFIFAFIFLWGAAITQDLIKGRKKG